MDRLRINPATKPPRFDNPNRAPSNVHFACLKCRIALKKPRADFGANADAVRIPCPECSSPMRFMGQTFKAPRRNAKRQWRTVELLLAGGFCFDGQNYGALPQTLHSAKQLLADDRRVTSGHMTRQAREQLEREQRSARIGAKRRKES